MYFVYTKEDCPACEKVKSKLTAEGTKFVERDASRLRSLEDEIDKEALVEASMQNMELPVVVEIYGKAEAAKHFLERN